MLTNKRTDLPPPEPRNPPTNFTQGDNTDAGGNPLPGFLLTGTFVSPTLSGAYALPTTVDGVLLSAANQATFDANGSLVQLDGAKPATPVTGGGNDGIVAWGTFVDTSSSYCLRLCSGVDRRQQTIFPSLAAGNMTGTYELTGKIAGHRWIRKNCWHARVRHVDGQFRRRRSGNGAALSSTLNWTWDPKAGVVGPASATLTGTTVTGTTGTSTALASTAVRGTASSAALNLSGTCGGQLLHNCDRIVLRSQMRSAPGLLIKPTKSTKQPSQHPVGWRGRVYPDQPEIVADRSEFSAVAWQRPARRRLPDAAVPVLT